METVSSLMESNWTGLVVDIIFRTEIIVSRRSSADKMATFFSSHLRGSNFNLTVFQLLEKLVFRVAVALNFPEKEALKEGKWL